MRSSSSEPSGSGPRAEREPARLPRGVDVARVEPRVRPAARCPCRPRRRPRRRAARARAAGDSSPVTQRAAGHGDAAVERDRGLVGDERPAARDPRAPGLVLARAPRRCRRARPRRRRRAAARARPPPRGSGRASRRRRARSRPRAPRRRTAASSRGARTAPSSRRASRRAPARRRPRARRPRRAGRPASVAPSPTTSPSGDDDRADRRLRIGAVPRAALGELERPLKAHASACDRAGGRRAARSSLREDAAAGDEQVGARLAHRADVLLLDAAVDLDEAVDQRRAAARSARRRSSMNSWPE